MADHNEFFDELYQQWSKTTGAKDTFWMPVETTDDTGQNDFFGHAHYWDVVAVDPNTDEKKWLGSFPNEADAEFVAGLHGAIPDLIRHLGEATDRAERLDEARDHAEGLAADALLENAALRERIVDLEKALGE
ncbi:hypothetical protein PBI_SHEAKEIRA_40 [Mycobacterium phage SheaKeira]|nr:hypothetical protein PBI_SHEAKEIRA_40 [Mycobacterium phage SheaKeira]